MSVAGPAAQKRLSAVLTKHVKRIVGSETARHRSDIGRVTSVKPLKIFLQGAGLELPASAFYFLDSCPPSKLRINDNVATTRVDGEDVVHDVVRRGGTTRLSGSSAHTVVNTTGLSSAGIDKLFVRAPPEGTVLADPTNHLHLVKLGGKWTKTTMTVIP